MLEKDSFALTQLWINALIDLPKRRASFFLTSLIAPLVFWLSGAVLAGIGAAVSLAGLAILILLAIIAVSSYLLLIRWKSRGSSERPSTRLVVTLHQFYYALMILGLSYYLLILALQASIRLEGPWFQAILIIYALSAVAGLLWAPRSIPRETEDEAAVIARDVGWLPWVLGVQGAIVSIGVFLGVWISHGQGVWTHFLIMGMGTLASLFMITMGFSIIYRSMLFAAGPIPGPALIATGVKP